MEPETFSEELEELIRRHLEEEGTWFEEILETLRLKVYEMQDEKERW